MAADSGWTGLIGRLERALLSHALRGTERPHQDFADLEEETEQAEATGAQQFKELMQESEVKTVVFQKD